MKPLILVTGGTGYIGSHTVVELQQSGFDVVIADNLANSNASVVDAIFSITGIQAHFELIDVCDETQLNNLFKKYPQITGVIHFAAFKAVGESVVAPLKYYYNNLVSLINLMKCMQNYNVTNFVFSSSCTVYGEPAQLPVTENFEMLKANSPYGNTKQICEKIIQDTIHSNDQIKCIALRYFNPAGAHSSALIGEYPIGVPNNLVPFITQTAIGKRDCLSVFGNDYPTPDGSCIRDFIHVVDLAKAHVISLNRLLSSKNKKNYEVFNIGTGIGNSVLEVIHAFEKVSNKKLNYKIAKRRAGDIVSIYADTTFANEELGWKAHLNLYDMLDSAWKWEQHLSPQPSPKEREERHLP